MSAAAEMSNAVTWEVEAFDSIDVSDGFEVTIVLGSEQLVSTTVGDRLRGAAEVEVRDGVLRIGLAPFLRKVPGDRSAHVAVRSLTRVAASGGSKVRVIGDVEGDEFGIGLSGASDCSARLATASADVVLSGTSTAILEGMAPRVQATLSGASYLSAGALQVEDLRIDASGTSNAEISVAETMDARATGTARITYSGSPELRRAETSGAARIVSG